MSHHPKPLKEQVIVLTGATSGIGLVTARGAAKRGAKLVLVARDEQALRQLADEITAAGGEAVAAQADVGDEEALRGVGEAAINAFGRVDTWINNAGVSVYGRLTQVESADHRRLFDTNFWGVVYGSLIAVEHLRKSGGVLVNVGSVLSDMSIPLQGMYSASKHAVKGFTDALRIEVEEEQLPIHVCLIKPSAIDTPYVRHAKNYLDKQPKNPAPVYDPDLVAQTILHCAGHPHREVTVGGGGRAMTAMATWLPRVADLVMERVMFKGQQTDEPAQNRGGDSLYDSDSEHGLDERGEYDGYVIKNSMYTKAALHPMITGATVVAAGAALAAGIYFVRGRSGARETDDRQGRDARRATYKRDLKKSAARPRARPSPVRVSVGTTATTQRTSKTTTALEVKSVPTGAGDLIT